MMVWIGSVLIDSSLTQVVVIDNALTVIVIRNGWFVYIIVWVDYGALVAFYIDRDGNLHDDLLLYYFGFVLKLLLL